MNEKVRGSEKLLSNRCVNTKLTEKDFANFVEMVEKRGGKVRDVFCYGIPAPEGISGTISVGKDKFDNLANGLLDINDLRVGKWEVFPYGIPVIDELHIKVDVRRGYQWSLDGG